MPNGVESALNEVRRPDVPPMFGREIVDGEQIRAVLGQAFGGTVIFHAVSSDEEIESGVDVELGFRHQLGCRACEIGAVNWQRLVYVNDFVALIAQL